jgi:predicted transcriptional regulator
MAGRGVRHVYDVDIKDTPTTTVRLPKELVEQVRGLARAHDRSLSAELRVALAAYVRQQPASDTRDG